MVLDGHLSEDMCVGVPKVAITHDTDACPTPHTYEPERWVMDPAKRVSAESVEWAHNAFQQFALCPRNYIETEISGNEKGCFHLGKTVVSLVG